MIAPGHYGTRWGAKLRPTRGGGYRFSARGRTMGHPTTLDGLLGRGRDDAPALAGLGVPAISYAALRESVAGVGAALAGRGIGPGDRVALIAPGGVQAAAGFLAVATQAAACPLNPAYTTSELRFALRDLGARLLLVPEGGASAAEAAAKECGVPVSPLGADPSGAARLEGPKRPPRRPEPGDEALALHTSGTTARPKLVPLSHANLCASARNIARALALRPEDRGLSTMPLFHVHGLVAGLLSALYAGGSVWCAPGFDALRWFRWLELGSPTWTTAVPSMHQAVLARAGRNRETAARSGLRLLRSSSAAMPPPILARLEDAFRAPVVESYGMTEAAQQICANPLPPGQRKAGTVGPAAGPEVRILDTHGGAAPAETDGEVAIRGETVTAGYADDPAANDAATTADGWFRTGDWGRLDADGYLTLAGRIKEIINRGGEKLSPAEIEGTLLAHPKVSEAVAFAVPHRSLGEDVGVAVVAADATEKELRDFSAERLAAFKVPRRLVLVDELPKGPTGKVSRAGMAARLGLEAE